MSAQTVYRFNSKMGAPGGISDLAPYAIDTFLNEEDHGVLKFGMGVVDGEKPGKTIAIPDDAEGTFQGVVTNNRTTEYDLEGKIYIRHAASVGVMRYGRIYARLAKDVTPKFGDPAYVVVGEDEDAGLFTTEKSGTLAIPGRFLTGADNGVAMVELFNTNVVAADED